MSLTMTIPTTPAPPTRERRVLVRPGGLVDVPAVVRLLVGPPAQAAAPCAGAPDPEQAARALRLLLAHYLLEEGEVWVAEGGLGHSHERPLAAAIWLPPDARPAGARLAGALNRELRHPFDLINAAERVRAALAAAGPAEWHWTLTTAGLLGEASDEALATELLAPGLRAADREGASVLAVTATDRQARQLRACGFGEPRRIPTGPDGCVWLTTRRPGRRDGPR
jgi:hypothetical protein